MIISLIIAFVVLILDQASKLYIVKNYELDEINYVIKDFLYITRTENPGAGWSMLSDATWLLCIISLLATAALVYIIVVYVKKFKNILLAVSLGMILGGTAGNLIDRFLTTIKVRDGVVDMVGMWIGSYQWPIWNVADGFLVVGVILLGIWGVIYLDRRRPDDKEVHSEGEEFRD